MSTEYIISKDITKIHSAIELEKGDWFNLWARREPPYKELKVGDTIYWLDNIKQMKLLWKSVITTVVKHPYSSKAEIYLNHPYEENKKYFDRIKKEQGFFLGFTVRVLESSDVVKPNVDMARNGWLKLNTTNKKLWFKDHEPEYCLPLTLSKKIRDLNVKMQSVSPTRAEKLINTIIRKDVELINLLKEAAGFKCQFPGCGHQIKTKDNGYYIEVAHIAAVNTGGQSILGNLVVLCPNHHKEFDYGHRMITEQSPNRLVGTLNGKDFEIRFDFNGAL